MTGDELLRFYRERKQQFATELAAVNKRINFISNVRVAVAIVFVAALYFGFRQTILLYTLPAIVAIFVLLVRNHGVLFELKRHLESLVKVNQNEIQASTGKVTDLDAGNEFVDIHHPYTHDLDIFGEGSLYQFINRCNTWSGKRKLADGLRFPPGDSGQIRSRQEAVRELAGLSEFRQQFQAAGMEMEERPEDRLQLSQWIAREPFLFGRWFYRYTLAIVPALTILLIVWSFFLPMVRPFAILAAASQWAFIGFHMKRINEFHEFISRKQTVLKKYSRLLHFLQAQQFASPLLNKLAIDASHADKKVERFAALASAFDARLNSMTMLAVNSILLYDLQCVYRLEKWKEENARDFDRWIDAVSETELLCSIGTFAFNHERFVFPQITGDLRIFASELGHPLIAEEECITNDLHLGGDHQLLIVTGANMAGKSTFLRTIGVNVILALNGAPVFAREFRCPVIRLHTGMRTADSLKDHHSYFYAELDRLHSIMTDLRSDVPMLVLLDEILKGTNSTDKQQGSLALVKQLLPHPCLAVIATHDLALGELEAQHPDRIKNYCFEANIENDQLSFDYRLKPGLAQRMNATFLMKKMGIIPS